MKNHRVGVAGALLLGALFFGGGAARAEEPESDDIELKAARLLFSQARQDEADGRWRDALEKFTRILALKATPSVLFHKAYCEEKVSLVLAAYEDFLRAGELNNKYPDGDKRNTNKKLIADETPSHLVALLPRVPTLNFRAPKGLSGLRVSIDDVEVRPEKLDKSHQVEVGRHSIEATAPGRAPFRSYINMAEGANETISIVFAEPASAPAPAAAPIVPSPQVPSYEDRGPSSGRKVAIWAGAGASVALAATGVGFFLKGRSIAGDLDTECSSLTVRCDRDKLESARDRNYLVAGVAGGLAAVGAGATVWLALSGGKRAPSAQQSLVLSPGAVTFRGSF